MKMGLLFLVSLMLAGCVTTASNSNQSVEQSPAYRAKLHTELGATYFSRGAYVVALHELNTAISDDEDYAPAYGMLGLVYFHFHENDKAEINFRKALTLTPNDPDLLNNYGWFVCQARDPSKSISYFRHAWENPLYATPEKAYDNGGVCALKMGNPSAADEDFHEALKANPQDAIAIYQLAELYFKQGNNTDANIFLIRLFRTVGDTPEGLWLGVRLAHREHLGKAQQAYSSRLLKEYPDSSQAKALRHGKWNNKASS